MVQDFGDACVTQPCCSADITKRDSPLGQFDYVSIALSRKLGRLLGQFNELIGAPFNEAQQFVIVESVVFADESCILQSANVTSRFEFIGLAGRVLTGFPFRSNAQLCAFASSVSYAAISSAQSFDRWTIRFLSTGSMSRR